MINQKCINFIAYKVNFIMRLSQISNYAPANGTYAWSLVSDGLDIMSSKPAKDYSRKSANSAFSNINTTILPNEVSVREFLLDIKTYGNICICQGALKSDS